jgi:hypothetical protein
MQGRNFLKGLRKFTINSSKNIWFAERDSKPAFLEHKYCPLQRGWNQIAIRNFSHCHVSGICVANKTGFVFDDRICWTLMQLVTTVHKSLSETLSSSDWTLHGYYSDFQVNCQFKSKVKVMLRPTGSRPVPWFKAPIWGLRLDDSCRLVDMGRSLWREDWSVNSKV